MILVWGENYRILKSGQSTDTFNKAVDSLPDTIDEEIVEHDPAADLPTVRLQCKDYGGNFSLPHYDKTRLERDYYISNLTMHNFVISDLSTHNSLR